MIELKHNKLKEVREKRVIDISQVSDMKSLIRSISLISKKVKDPNIANVDKGNVFEIFGEFFIKELGKHNDIGIVDYEPAQVLEDYGVDGVGIGLDAKPATTQMKFRSNPNRENTYEEASKFMVQSEYDYGVEALKNMLFISTAFKMNQHALKMYTAKGGRFLGLRQFYRIIGSNNIPFWTAFKESWNKSQPLGKRIYKKRFKHQERMIEAGERLINSTESRGWIGCGTGGGKTLAINDISEKYLKDNELVVIAAPRIALCEQLKKELHDNKTIDYKRFLFHSGGREEINLWKGDVASIQNSTTSKEKIKSFVKENLGKHNKMIIFTTYHSSLKLGQTLEGFKIKYLYMADECHNLVSAERSSILDQIKFDKFIGFTVTAKEDRLGYGMQEYSRWGRRICEVTPAELFQNGITVPPRGYFLKIKDSQENETFEIDAVNKLIRRFKDEIYPTEIVKIVVTCSGVQQAHKMADEDALDKLVDFEKFVVTSNMKSMGSRRRESELKQFTECTKDTIIFHYDMLGEGIDVPSVTAVLPFRSLDNIKVIQNVGRANRLVIEDREKLRNGLLKVDERSDWAKPYAWVLCPFTENDPKSNHTYQNVLKLLSELRNPDFNFCVEEYMYIGSPTTATNKDNIDAYDIEENECKQNIINDLEIFQEQEAKINAACVKEKANELVEVTYELPQEDVEWLDKQDDPFEF